MRSIQEHKLETALNLVTSVSSINSLDAVCEALRLLSRDDSFDNAFCESVNLAISQLGTMRGCVERHSALSDSFENMSEPWVIFSGGKCIKVSQGAFDLLMLSKPVDSSHPDLIRMQPLVGAGRNNSLAWTLSNGRKVNLELFQFDSLSMIRLQGSAPVVVDERGRAESLGFSPRQVDVVGLIAKGLSTKEVATQMGCSVNTVRAHIRAIISKLGVSGRCEALAALRGGKSNYECG